MKKILIFILIFIMSLSVISCSNEEKDDPNNSAENVYSVGLDQNGYYIDLDKQDLKAPNFEGTKIIIDNIFKHAIDELQQEGYTVKTEDEFIDSYIVSYLSSTQLNTKDTVENTDIVTASIVFYDLTGALMEDYASEKTSLVAKEDGDSIVSGIIGHKKGESFELSYTFSKDDQYNPGKEVKVKIEIFNIAYADPIANNVIENNIEELQKEFPGITDLASLRARLRPYIAQYNLSSYLETLLLASELKVPDEYAEYEFQRFLCRLNQLGYTYEKYLSEAETTNDAVRETCKKAAVENLISMLIFRDNGYEITKEIMDDKYRSSDEDYAYYVSVQGEPYMKLRIIRATALDIIAGQISLVEADGSEVEFGKITSLLQEISETENNENLLPEDSNDTDQLDTEIPADTNVETNKEKNNEDITEQ